MESREYGIAAAAAIVLFLFIFVFTMIQLLIQKKWRTGGERDGTQKDRPVFRLLFSHLWRDHHDLPIFLDVLLAFKLPTEINKFPPQWLPSSLSLTNFEDRL